MKKLLIASLLSAQALAGATPATAQNFSASREARGKAEEGAVKENPAFAGRREKESPPSRKRE